MPRKVVELPGGCKGLRGNIHVAVVWKIILHCITWYLWMERSHRCFEDQECSLDELKRFFLNSLFMGFGH